MATKDELKLLNTTLFPDNDDGLIEPEDLREFNDEMIDSLPETLPPSGNAGGDLSGNYPNPLVKDEAITLVKLAKEVRDRLKYREFSAILRPILSGSGPQDWLLETTENGVITGRDDTIPTNWSQYYTFNLTITPAIWSKIVKSSLQVSGKAVWPAIYEIRHYTNYNVPGELNHIQVQELTLDGSNVSNAERIYIRFLIEND